MSARRSAATDDFIESMGLVCQAEGLSRTAGRILGMLMLFGGPVGFEEIADYLQTSRSGVSTNTRDLERLGVIRRVSRPGERQYFFEVSDHALGRLLMQRLASLHQAQSAVDTALDVLGDDWRDARPRLKRLKRLYALAISKTGEVIKEMSESPPPKKPSGAKRRS